jgi:hypothetical protein
MRNGVIKLVMVVVGLNMFFMYIGLYFLPQSESHPPRVMEIAPGVEPDVLAEIGEKILFGKGQCMVCHPMNVEVGMRSPAIGRIGADIISNADKRGMSPEDYLFESLVNPSAHVLEGYADMMPPIHKPPTELTEGELIAVGAYLQSRGAEITVTYPGSVDILNKQIDKIEGAK